MIKNILSAVIFSVSLCNVVGQTSYNVSANFGLVFSPSSLTINVGDTVVWTNTGGTHNVNGTQATYPNNPVSFDNGAVSSASWTYQFVFTVAGTYDYRCDQHFGSGMVGIITVNAPNSILEIISKSDLTVYPNPFSSSLTVQLDKNILNNNVDIEFILYDLLGNQVRKVQKITSELTQVSTGELSHGIYIYSFKSKGKVLKTGKLTNN